MINPFRPSRYISVSSVLDKIAERENEHEIIKIQQESHKRGDKHWLFYAYKSGKLAEKIVLLRSVLKAKLKP